MSRAKRTASFRMRHVVQAGFLALVVVIGVQFSLWAFALIAGRPATVARPPGVEGFLPISALMSLRVWLAGYGIHPVHPAGLGILVAVLVMSAVVAKSFCSHVCPVGTLSEALGRLGVRLLGRTWVVPRWLDVPLRSLKFLILGFFVWATWLAMSAPAARGFLDSPYNRVADVKMMLFFAHPTRVTIAVLGVLVVGSVLVRDVWCRYLCPYGALIGLLGRVAPFKVTRDAAACTDCRACTRACPARLPVHAMRRVASIECTSCQDCVAACPVKDCLAVRLPGPALGRRAVRPRTVIVAAAALFLAIVAGFRLAGHWRSSVSEQEYTARLVHIESSLYTHFAGAGGVPESPAPRLARAHEP